MAQAIRRAHHYGSTGYQNSKLSRPYNRYLRNDPCTKLLSSPVYKEHVATTLQHKSSKQFTIQRTRSFEKVLPQPISKAVNYQYMKQCKSADKVKAEPLNTKACTKNQFYVPSKSNLTRLQQLLQRKAQIDKKAQTLFKNKLEPAKISATAVSFYPAQAKTVILPEPKLQIQLNPPIPKLQEKKTESNEQIPAQQTAVIQKANSKILNSSVCHVVNPNLVHSPTVNMSPAPKPFNYTKPTQSMAKPAEAAAEQKEAQKQLRSRFSEDLVLVSKAGTQLLKQR